MRFLIIINLLSFLSCSAQKKLFFSPSLGFALPQSYILDRGTAESTFKVNRLVAYPAAQLAMQFQNDEKQVFSVGISVHDQVYGFMYGPRIVSTTL
jgi:hypothetical protein